MAVRWLFRAQFPREQSALVEGDRELVLERAYAIARVAGGALAMVVAPAFGVSFVVVVLMVTCTVAGPGLLHMWLWRRTKTPAGRDRVRWLAVADDCMCAIFALAVFARDPMWSITLVVPLLIFVEMIRAGAPGAIIAAQDRFGDGVLIRKGDRFVFVGDAMRRITGYDPKDLETLRSMLSLVVPSDREAIAERLKLPGPDRFETRLLHKEGREVPVEI